MYNIKNIVLNSLVVISLSLVYTTSYASLFSSSVSFGNSNDECLSKINGKQSLSGSLDNFTAKASAQSSCTVDQMRVVLIIYNDAVRILGNLADSGYQTNTSFVEVSTSYQGNDSASIIYVLRDIKNNGLTATGTNQWHKVQESVK